MQVHMHQQRWGASLTLYELHLHPSASIPNDDQAACVSPPLGLFRICLDNGHDGLKENKQSQRDSSQWRLRRSQGIHTLLRLVLNSIYHAISDPS